MQVIKTIQSIRPNVEGAVFPDPVDVSYYIGDSLAQVTSALAMCVAEIEDKNDYYRTLAIRVVM